MTRQENHKTGICGTWGSPFGMKPLTGLCNAIHVRPNHILLTALVGRTSRISSPILDCFSAGILGRIDVDSGCVAFSRIPWFRCQGCLVEPVIASPAHLAIPHFHPAVLISTNRRVRAQVKPSLL